MIPHEPIIAALKRGEADQVFALLKSASGPRSKDDALHGFRAMAHAIKGQHAEAKSAFRDAMRHAPDAVTYLKHGGNFAAYLIRIGATDDLKALAQEDWPLADAVGSERFDEQALVNLCSAMLQAGQLSFLADHLPDVVVSRPSCWEVERALLIAFCELGRPQQALARIGAQDFACRDLPACRAIACFATASAGRHAEATQLLDEYVETAPPYIAKAEKTQRAALVLISPKPRGKTLLESLPRHYLNANYPAQIARKFSGQYRIAAIFAGAGQQSVREALSTGAAVAINNCVNAERLKEADIFNDVRMTEDMTGLRIVNAAAQAVHTTRQENALRLAALAGAVVPRVMRYRMRDAEPDDVAEAMLAEFRFPFILRVVGLQQGEGMFLVSDRATLVKGLAEIAEPHVLAMDYIGQRQPNGHFRRLRAAIVKGVPTIMRADYHDDWIVHGRKMAKCQRFYLRFPDLLKDADDIVNRPEERLGKVAMSALADIGKMIPLDIFGVDFDVDTDGRLMFFEANATMNLLSNAPAQIDYPANAERMFMSAVDKLLFERTLH
jgi:hypothetical protein